MRKNIHGLAVLLCFIVLIGMILIFPPDRIGKAPEKPPDNPGKDWNQVYSLAEEYEGYFPFGSFNNLRGSQNIREFNVYSGNFGKMIYNFGESQSRNAYNTAFVEIRARTDITDEEKAELIREADGKVCLSDNNPLADDLNFIRAWNEEHPDGPKKYYRQHVIAWHGDEQNPAFYHKGFDLNAPLASDEVMNARLDSYIEAMFRRYQEWDDIIISWDIVNEALDDYKGMVRNGFEDSVDDADSQPSAWGTIYRHPELDNDPDMRLLAESEWVRTAFASARKWQQELGVHWKLYYNDYMNSNMLYEPKMTNTLKILRPIYEAGNIDGYGLQGRLSYVFPSVDMLRNQIEECLKVADEISISEMDVRSDFEVNPNYDPGKETRRVTADDGDDDYNNGGSGSYSRAYQNNGNTYDVWNGPVRRRNNFDISNIDEKSLLEQADYYADVIDLFLELAAENKVGSVSIDGTDDNNTFNRDTGCSVWDVNGNEKPAFYALIGAPNRYTLRRAVESCPTMSEKAGFTSESWVTYAAALEAAEDFVGMRVYDADGVEAVKKAAADLIEAAKALVEASEGAD